tara:strand:- start:9 stop:356 length:348 start_codon:yes stop_codon:yes gene_type:complete
MFNKEEKPTFNKDWGLDNKKRLEESREIFMEVSKRGSHEGEGVVKEEIAGNTSRRLITTEDQDELKKQFKEMMGKDKDVPISCSCCQANTYYSLVSQFPDLKSEIRWSNLKLDYK